MTTSANAYEFGQFCLDLDLFELRRQGQIIPLQRRQMDVLIYLIENRARLVGKDELLDTIWPDVKVSEAALATAIRGVRRALGDSGQRQQMITTRKRFGFRFIAPILEPEQVRELEFAEPIPIARAQRQYA